MSDAQATAWTIIVVSVLIGVGLFLLFRAVALWYWRVNDIVRTLEDIRALQREQVRWTHESRDGVLALVGLAADAWPAPAKGNAIVSPPPTTQPPSASSSSPARSL